jgi:type I restriction enzyme M protein
MNRPRINDAIGSATLVRKLWQYCNVLRDDGLSYPDYVEQLTYLLFLKMSDEQQNDGIPREYAWRSFAGLSADAMHRHYGRVLTALGDRGGMLGVIFRNAKNKIRDPAKLRLLVIDLIGRTDWTGLSTDVKGDAYEGLLEKNARDTKSGAGQYFTPRPLIQAIVECVDPRPGEVVCDPACGTGGFLLAATEHIRGQNPRMKPSEMNNLTRGTMRGVELVEEVARLATMNLMLHGISSTDRDQLPIVCADSLRHPPDSLVDVVLTNPPFGVKGSVTYLRDRGEYSDDDLVIARPDFWVQTANKQLNFLQHVHALLKTGGRAAIVLPDNVLFEGGAAAAIRRQLLSQADVHTLLRLPTGLFYAQSVKANVLFFERPKEHGVTPKGRSLFVYDLRTDGRFSLKTRPLQREDLDDFVRMYRYGAESPALKPESGDLSRRWRCFDVGDILASQECSLDLAWRDETADSPASLARLNEISRLIAADLQRALGHLASASSAQREDK